MNNENVWVLTDDDCCQYVRKNGSIYEMVQIVWLDTTSEDRAKGLSEYCIVYGSVDMKALSKDDIDIAISGYGYEEKPDEWICAECYLEENILSDACVIGEADTLEKAEIFVKKYIGGVQ